MLRVSSNALKGSSDVFKVSSDVFQLSSNAFKFNSNVVFLIHWILLHCARLASETESFRKDEKYFKYALGEWLFVLFFCRG